MNGTYESRLTLAWLYGLAGASLGLSESDEGREESRSSRACEGVP